MLQHVNIIKDFQNTSVKHTKEVEVMLFIEKIKNFVTGAVNLVSGVKDTSTVQKQKSSASIKSEKQEQENKLVDTSFLTESKSAEKESGGFWKTLGRIALGICTLGISELVRAIWGSDGEESSCNVNGKLDEDVQQGQLGDCVFISTMYSLSQSENGAKILNDAITVNYDEENNIESYTVNFKGIDEKVTITKEELDAVNNDNWDEFYEENGYAYSKGDDDMLLFELAWQKLNENENVREKLTKMDSGVRLLNGNEKGPLSLWNVSVEQVIGAFTDFTVSETWNDVHNMGKKYYEDHADEFIEKLENLKGSFKPSDVGMSGINCYHKSDGTLFELSEDSTCTIEKIDDYNYLIKNLSNGTELELSKRSLTEYMKIPEDKIMEFKRQAINSINNSKPDYMLMRTGYNKDGENIFVPNHCYAVKELTDTTITLVNPWNTSEIITMTIDEYINSNAYSIVYGYLQD